MYLVEQVLNQSPSLSWQEWIKQDCSAQIEDVVFHFLMSLRCENTRTNYARDLREFFKFIKSMHITITEISQVNEKMILLWREELGNRHFIHEGNRKHTVNSSIARTMCALSSCLEFALKRGLIQKNPARLVELPRVKQEGKTNALSENEVKEVLALAKNKMEEKAQTDRSYRSNAMNYAIISTLLSVGMRVDELCELRIGDIEIQPEYTRLHMRVKGGECHSPIIHPHTVQVLQEYIEKFRMKASRDDFLFTRAQNTSKRNKLGRSSVARLLQKLIKEAKIEKRISPHSCRATLATLLHKKGVPIGEIQDLLNHKKITTTSLYIKKADEKQKSAAIKLDVIGL